MSRLRFPIFRVGFAGQFSAEPTRKMGKNFYFFPFTRGYAQSAAPRAITLRAFSPEGCLTPETANRVVIDDADRLHPGIDDDWPNKLKSPSP